MAALSSLPLACRTPDTTPPVEDKTPPAKQLTSAQILAASELPPLVETPIAGDEMGVTVHRLSNGMTVYISTDRQKPRFSAWIAVRTGSRNDPANSTGLAHYLEHMLFKGTDDYGTLDLEAEQVHLEAIAQLYAELRGADEARRAQIFSEIDQHTQAAAAYAIPNELDRMYAALGIEGVNAFTSNEVTAYIGDVPSNRLEAWAKIEGERFSDPVFRLFYPELEAVYEEKNLSIDRPESRIWDTMLLALFPEHPYGTQPTIGVVEHLKNPAYGDMVQYFQDWYAPNNMAVILAGDIDAATALPVLEASLGQIPARTIGTKAPAKLPPLQGRVEHEVIAEGEQSVTMAWRTVNVTHADEPAIVVADWLMDNSSSGLLNVELELTQKVQDAGSWASHLNDAGYFGVRATLRQDQTHAEVEQLLYGVVAKLAAGEFTQDEIDAIKLHEDLRDKRTLESNHGRVSRMMESYIERRPWAEMIARDQRLRAVTREDVIRVANQYLTSSYVVVNRKSGTQDLPNIQKPSITPIDIDATRESPFAADIKAMPASQLEPEWLVEGEHYEHLVLPAGPMIAARNTRNDLFSLKYRFDRGHRKAQMLCVALELLERSGSGTTSAEALQKQLFALGTSVSFACGAEYSNIDIEGFDKNLEQSVQLVEAWIRDPKFDDDTLAGLRRNLISEREDELDDSDNLAQMLSAYASYGDRSAYLRQPSNAAINKVTAKQLRKQLTSFPDYTHSTLYYGPRTPAEAAKVVGLGRKHKPAGPREQRRFRDGAQGTTIYFLHKDVAKSAVSLAIPQGLLPHDQIPVSEYFANYIGGGMSSLIFQEIREARGLAYYAYAYVARGVTPEDECALVGGMGTQADKTVDALTLYLQLLRERPIDANRLGQTRESLDAEYRASRIDPRWIVLWVDSWDREGEKQDPRPWEWEQIQTLGVEQVQTYASGYADRPTIISIVGDRSRVDLQALAKLGTVIEVEPKQLTSYF
ncbi:ZINC protease [Enhygromyxa salina]|uniref:ZINC protease n=1 Tax=Enhygromyxa salina TaxID=215803 RepID=A0A0C2DI16_9BACT|nr:ZINC protease [Enhygromyxa salina]